MDRFANPVSIIILTVGVIIIGAGLISAFSSLLHDTENPSRAQAASLAAGMIAGLAFMSIVIFPFGATYTTTSGKRIATLAWPLGIGIVGRGTFVEFVNEENDAKVGLVVGLEGETITVKDGRVMVNGQAMIATGANLPGIQPICAREFHVLPQSILVAERFISSWVDGKELACEQFVPIGSWKNVHRHLFYVTWPWELFGLSRIDLTVAEK